MKIIDRARSYISKMLPALSGNGGHAATFAAACRLVQFGLSFEEAMSLLAEWNDTHCKPTWTEAELKHKLVSAFQGTFAKPEFATKQKHVSPVQLSRLTASVPLTATQSKRATADFSASFLDESVAERQFLALATLRGLSIEGIRLSHARRLLQFGQHQGRAAWFVLDESRRVAQARRLDGQPWTPNAKAWTLRGSQATWPVGVAESVPFPTIAICEGGPDLLAAHHFIWAENREHDCAAVAILGAANINADALPFFAGKRVRIFRHVDATGDAATNRWAKQIEDAGADVDAFDFDGLRQADGSPIEDLNDCARVSADDFETHRCLWNLLP